MCLNSFSSVPPERRALLREMQQLNFGRIEGLTIQAGQPQLDPNPTVTRELKFGGENDPRAELAADDFCLKQQVVELFAFFDELRNGVIDVLEIKNGLPFRMTVTEEAA